MEKYRYLDRWIDSKTGKINLNRQNASQVEIQILIKSNLRESERGGRKCGRERERKCGEERETMRERGGKREWERDRQTEEKMCQ